MLRSALFAVLSAALSACTPDAPATSAGDAEAKRFETQPGMAAVYVVRASDMFVLGAAVSINGQAPVMVGRRDYLRVDVPPGPSRIVCGEGDTTHVLNLAAGQTAFIEAAVTAGFVTGRCVLIPRDDANGRELVMSGRRLAPR